MIESHLILIALGPVQEFIAQARRTRDLWYGSHLLSEVSRRAAKELAARGAKLVFPALEANDDELGACLTPLRPDTKQPPLNIANRILAELPAPLDPNDIARSVRTAVQEFWRDEIAAPVKQHRSGLIARPKLTDGVPTIDEVWEEQIATLLELTAVWAPLGVYEDTRKQLENAMAARKNLRDFRPWSKQRGDVPKSSLDGARETILAPPSERDQRLAQRLRIADNEQLDAVGLVKRAGGAPDQFLPIVNIALASWIELVERELPDALSRLRRACRDLDLARVLRNDLPAARPFSFDASILLPSRWKPLFKEQGLSGDPEAWGRKHVAPVLDKVSEPFPYVACIVADGDRMGDAIKALARSSDDHRLFSSGLAGFASRAREVVEQRHRGSLVYAGGDDVLAFVPVPEALACAEALRREFEATMATVCQTIPGGLRPTLSVGIGIGHVMEGMGELLALGRSAEKLAKGAKTARGALYGDDDRDRNALAVLVDRRSGGRRSWRARWDDWEGDPVARVQADVELLREELPSRKVYEIAQTWKRLPGRDELHPGAHEREDRAWANLLAMEVRRSLARVRSDGGVDPATLGLSLEGHDSYRAIHTEVARWVDRMLVARNFASAVPTLRSRSENEAA